MYPSRFNFFQEDGEDKDDDKELDETLDEIETETKEEDSDLGRAVFTEASLYLNPMERPTRLKEFSEAGKKMISSV